MKKIKFRAWDTERSVMAQVNYLGLNDDEVGMEDEECRCWNAPYPYVCKLMQYTGLKDENGDEIYDDDIVKMEFDMFFMNFGLNENVKEHGNKYYFTGKVCFSNGTWMVENQDEEYYLYNVADTIYKIGNIHENPELIK